MRYLYSRISLSKIICLALVFCLLSVVFSSKATFPNCSLCGVLRHHAPCLVSLSTGEITELIVYDPDPNLIGEISNTQQTGTFSFIQVNGIIGVRDTSAHTCTVKIPNHRGQMTAYFCSKCRNLFSQTANEGFILLDLYDLDAIHAYPVTDGADYTIRDYDISVRHDETTEYLTITVTGRLFS